MINFRKEQIRFERDTWSRSLYHMMNENIYFKIRFSEILKIEFDQKCLHKAELFQARFLKLDAQIAMLRVELAELSATLETVDTMVGIEHAKLNIETIRNNIKKAEKNFVRLRLDFICTQIKCMIPVKATLIIEA